MSLCPVGRTVPVLTDPPSLRYTPMNCEDAEFEAELTVALYVRRDAPTVSTTRAHTSPDAASRLHSSQPALPLPSNGKGSVANTTSTGTSKNAAIRNAR
ncbi:hypothetical protein KEM60_00841 [Austwickia sp. TVS 96-490-7B]|nr:hypothetical protein [Austwickia sp. TVS 96-490-7B]